MSLTVGSSILNDLYKAADSLVRSATLSDPPTIQSPRFIRPEFLLHLLERISGTSSAAICHLELAISSRYGLWNHHDTPQGQYQLIESLDLLFTKAISHLRHETSPRPDPRYHHTMLFSPYHTYCTNAQMLSAHPPRTYKQFWDRSLLGYMVLKGVTHLHRRGFCHNAISSRQVQIAQDPSNGFFYGRLIDAGSVTLTGATIRYEEGVIPNPAKLCELQFQRADSDHDLWCFGLFLFEIFYGRSTNSLNSVPVSSSDAVTSMARKNALSSMLELLDRRPTEINRLIQDLLKPGSEHLSSISVAKRYKKFFFKEMLGSLVSPNEIARCKALLFKPQMVAMLCSVPMTDSQKKNRMHIVLGIASFLQSAHQQHLCCERLRSDTVLIEHEPKSGMLFATPITPIVSPGTALQEERESPQERLSLSESRASIENDLLSFGLILFELFHGNSPTYSVRTTPRCSAESLKQMLSRLKGSDPVDQLISSLLGPPQYRPSAADIVTKLSDGRDPRQCFILSQHTKLIIIHDIVRQLVRLNPKHYVPLSLPYLYIITDNTGDMVIGARMLARAPRQDLPLYREVRFGAFKQMLPDLQVLIFEIVYGEIPWLSSEISSAVEFIRSKLSNTSPTDQILSYVITATSLSFDEIFSLISLLLDNAFDRPRIPFKELLLFSDNAAPIDISHLLTFPERYAGPLEYGRNIVLEAFATLKEPSAPFHLHRLIQSKIHPYDVQQLLILLRSHCLNQRYSPDPTLFRFLYPETCTVYGNIIPIWSPHPYEDREFVPSAT